MEEQHSYGLVLCLGSLLFIVEVVTTSRKAACLVILVFSSAEAIDSIQTKE